MDRSVADSADVRTRYREYLVPAVAPMYAEPVVLVRGQGRHVEDMDGRRYLDFFGGILVTALGHAHPRVLAAARRALDGIWHTSPLYPTEAVADLAELMARVAPAGLTKSYFTSSGTEANETAVIMSRIFTGRREVVTLRHGYSGHSAAGLSMTGQAPWKTGLESVPGVVHTMTAYCYRCPFHRTPTTCGLECAKDLEEVLDTQTTGRPAALLAEPIQGVGGFVTPPAAFFQEIARIIRDHGGLFISDEVQTGFGRTGRMWGIEESGVAPDLITYAKGIANGMPAGGVTARPEIADAYVGPAVSTFGGNPIAAAAARATVETVIDDGLVENSRLRGQELRAGLEELQARYPAMGDVRGRGLMQAVEFVREGKAHAPDLMAEFLEATRDAGLLVGRGGLRQNVARIAPALTVTAQEIQDGLGMIGEAMARLYRRHPELPRRGAGAAPAAS
jgi:4-aminobutyrate aminotransferase-like enzyme